MKTLLLFMVVSFFSYTLAGQPIVTRGLVAYFPFNSNASDESGNGNDAVVYAASLASDRFGVSNSAYSFNGIDNYIEAVNTTLPTTHASRTVCFWLKSLQNSLTTIINFGTIEAIDTMTILDIYFHNGSVKSYIPQSFAFGGWATNDNQWHHVAVIYEDTTRFFLYQDGHQNAGMAGPGVKLNTIGSSMRIGAPLSHAQNRRLFSGVLDEIRIYNCALTDMEIDSLYQENVRVQDVELAHFVEM